YEEEDESFDDDEDDDIDIEEDEKEDEYLAPADSTAVTLPAVNHAPSAEETEPFETDESVATPPPHPAYRAERWEIPEAHLTLWKRLCTTHIGTYDLGESSAAAAASLGEPVRDDLYRFVDTVEQGEGSTPADIEVGNDITDAWDDLVGAIQEIASTTVEGVNMRVTELFTTFDLETSMIYAMIEEKRDDQALQRARVNRLFRDRRYHARTASLMEGEARASRTAWALSMDASDAARFRTTVGTQQEEIKELRAADRKLQAQFIQALTSLKSCQTQLTAALGRIQILEAARGVAKALVARDADRNTNGDDSHVSGTSARRTKRNTGRVYTAGSREKKPYGGSKPLCPKFNYHHNGPCALKCHKCNKVGHFACDCRSTTNVNTTNNQRGNRTGQKPTYYECGDQGHFKKDCPKLKNKNHDAQGGNATALTKVSFVSTAFSSQIDITPTTLDHYYDVELADRRIIRLNSILRGYTLNFLNHPFNIDLMPVELGSFDAIIGMDWLEKYHAVIVCAEKIVRIPWGNEILIVHGDGSDQGNESRLNIISCTKTQKYMLKGCPVFMEHITTKETEDKSEKKRLEDVPIVQNFLEVFPKDLSSLPLTRQVEFQIDLMPGAAPIARAPYRLASSEMKELSDQLKELSEKGFIRPSSLPWGALNKLCSAPILALPEGSDDFVVYCDASHKELGAILMKREKRHYLYGTKSMVFTYHNSLQHILDQNELNMRQHRWLELLSDYDCKICYHPGKTEARKPENIKNEDVGGMLELLAKALGTSLDMSTAYHTEIDEQSERTIQTLKDMLCACVIDFRKGWVNHFSLVEFLYNNSYHTSIKAVPFEALYSQKCRLPICWTKVGEAQLLGPELIQETTKKIIQIKQRIVVRFGKRGKLNLRYVGPFKVLDKVRTVSYKLKLLQELSRVHNMFHVFNLKKCHADEPLAVLLDDLHFDDKLHFVEEPVEIIDREVKRLK
nr:hypothetical protein [Tanacetum cinerariifolium]